MIEIGRGNGSVMRHLEHHKINMVGIYISRDPSVFYTQYSRALNYQEDVFNAPFLNNIFDIVDTFFILEPIEDEVTSLRKMFSIYDSGVWVFLTVPAHGWFLNNFDTLSNHECRYRQRTLPIILHGMGLTPIYSFYFMFFFLSLLILSRIPQYLLRRSRTCPSLEFGIVVDSIPFISWLLIGVPRLEWMLMLIVPLFFGSSLILIARKLK
jgi:hypothetical protein